MGTVYETRETREETLYWRVDDAIRSHKSLLLSTMGPQAAIGELVRRDEGLVEALHEIALEVEKLAGRPTGGAPHATEHVAAIRSRPRLSAAGPHTAVTELVKRNLGLEKAVRAIALDVQKLADSHEA